MDRLIYAYFAADFVNFVNLLFCFCHQFVKHDNQRMITENPEDEMALFILLSFHHIEYFSE